MDYVVGYRPLLIITSQKKHVFISGCLYILNISFIFFNFNRRLFGVVLLSVFVFLVPGTPKLERDPLQVLVQKMTLYQLMSYEYLKLVCSLLYFRFSSNVQARPYNDDSTASRPLCEVKHHLARLVLRWGTTLESRVLCFLFCCKRFGCYSLSLAYLKFAIVVYVSFIGYIYNWILLK
jgi:hypothetical protein